MHACFYRRPALSIIAMVFLLALAAPGNLLGQHSITLTNGDHLTGTFTRIDGSFWKFNYLGQDQNIPLAEIATITIESPLGWRLADGSILAGTLSFSGSDVTIGLSETQTQSVALTDIVALGAADNLEALVPVEVGLFSPISEFWSALASLGITSKSGNSRDRGFSGTLEFERKTERDRLVITLGAVRQESSTDSLPFETTVSRYAAGVRGEIFASNDLFTFLQTRFERDSFQDLALRSSNSLGIGFRPIASDGTDLRLSGSGGLQIESFLTSGIDNATDAIATVEAELQQELGVATLRWKTELTTLPKEFSDYRFRSDASLTISVIEGLGFRIAAITEYDNSPQPGVQKTDNLLSTTLTYTLGR